MEGSTVETTMAPFVLATPEYARVTSYISLLKTKRERALKDIQSLKKLKEEYLLNPKQLIDQTIARKLPRFPAKQFIPSVPYINFNKYLKPQEIIVQANPAVKDIEDSKIEPAVDPARNGISFTSLSSSNNGEVATNNKEEVPAVSIEPPKKKYKKKQKEQPETTVDPIEPTPGEKVRGRTYTQEKPMSFNKLWNEEEQKRLEELLMKYPEEEIASHRWSKIAQALGNRTPKQVASRTQKYFIKLAREGKPVPGKIPNLEIYTKPKKKRQGINTDDNNSTDESRKKAKNTGKDYYMPPPVYMSDDDDQSIDFDDDDDDEQEEETTTTVNESSSLDSTTTEQPELMKKVKKVHDKKSKEKIVPRGIVEHLGFKCDCCGVEPIVGIRYYCSVCSKVNLCETCKSSQFEIGLHDAGHGLVRVDLPEGIPYYLDNTYHQYSTDQPNYLDPLYRVDGMHSNNKT